MLGWVEEFVVHLELYIRFFEDNHSVFELLNGDVPEDVGLKNRRLEIAFLLIE